MDNQYFKIRLSDTELLELYVCDTNEVEPYRKIKELGIVIHSKEKQIYAGLSEVELNSLIKYLHDCEDHIKSFNANPKPSTSPPHT